MERCAWYDTVVLILWLEVFSLAKLANSPLRAAFGPVCAARERVSLSVFLGIFSREKDVVDLWRFLPFESVLLCTECSTDISLAVPPSAVRRARLETHFASIGFQCG